MLVQQRAVMCALACVFGSCEANDMIEEDMVWIPEVTLSISTCNGRRESCSRLVHVKSFAIDRLEVARREFELADTKNMTFPQLEGWPSEPVLVTHKDAQIYCTARGARLPTSDEWQAAARFGNSRYPWGDTPISDCSRVFHEDCPWPLPAAGTASADVTILGVRDTFGSAPEWVDDPAAKAIVHGSATFRYSMAAPRTAETAGFRCAR
jgi:formylglycine-generating enzyme required for sulfatase activity